MKLLGSETLTLIVRLALLDRDIAALVLVHQSLQLTVL